MKITFLLLLGVLMISCLNTVDPALPEPTQSGKNTFGFLIDDQLWLPKKATSIFGSPPELTASYNHSTNELKIEATQFQSGGGSSFGLKAFVQQPGKAKLLSDQNNVEYQTYYYGAAEYFFPQGDSTLIITKLDTLNKIVSGNFSLAVLGQKTNRRVHITQGIFDLRFESR